MRLNKVFSMLNLHGVVCPKYEKLCHVFRAEYSQYVESCRLCIDMNYTLMSNEQITDNLAIIVHLKIYMNDKV